MLIVTDSNITDLNYKQMKKDEIFFAPENYTGVQLTQTSANHTANMAKELYSTSESALNNMVFYTTKLSLLGSAEEKLLREGTSTVANISDTLKDIANLKSLIAWLREAIKAKERLISEAQCSGFDDYGIEVPERPERAAYISKEDYIATLGIKERNRYYYLEAVCATIGQYIHPDGVYAQQRAALKKVIAEPNTVQGSGRDTLLYSKTPSLPLQEVEDTFMSLQNTYRSYQAELNSIKYQIEDAVNKDTAAKNIEYSKAIEDYNNKMAMLNAQLEEKRKQAVLAASNLKIIIPDSLKAIYERVNSLGKD